MSRLLKSFAALAFAVTVAPWSSALACQGTKAQFDDDFKTADPGWGNPNETMQIGDGKLTFKMKTNDLYWSWNSSFAYSSGMVCAEFKLVGDTADPKSSAAALMFWVKDGQNFYTFKVTPSGDYWVGRLLDNKWVPSSIGVKNSPDLKKGKGDVNEIAVKFEGQQLTLYVNGKEQVKFRAQSPEGQSYAGMYAQSAEKSADTYEFSNFKVMAIDPAAK